MPFDLKTCISKDSFWPARRVPRLPRASRVHHLFPDSSLGGFISGTLNFKAERARELIAAGEAKGKAFIENLARGSLKQDAPTSTAVLPSYSYDVKVTFGQLDGVCVQMTYDTDATGEKNVSKEVVVNLQ